MGRRADYSKLWDELEKRLTELLGRLDGILSPDDARWAREFIDHNEFGVAWQAVADALIQTETTISDEDFRELLELAKLMGIADEEAADELEALRLLAG